MSLDAPRLREDLLVHAGFVHALARAALRGDSECEDLEQDVWSAALVGAPAEPSRQRPWLVSVIRRRAADLLRRRARRERRELVRAVAGTAPSAADSVARAEIGRRLVSAVLALDEPFRTAVLLRFQDGLAPRDVATRTGVPVETARSRVRRGLERLRVALEERERHDGRSARGVLSSMGFEDRVSTPPSALLPGGLLVMKKAVAIAALMLAVAGGGLLWFSSSSKTNDPANPVGREVGRSGAGIDPAPDLAPQPIGPAMAVSAAPLASGTVAAASPPKTVRGRLVGEDGTPIAGARILTGGVNESSFFGDTDLPGASDSIASTTVVTGEDGRFEVKGQSRYGGPARVYPHASGWYLPTPPFMNGVMLSPSSETNVQLKRGVSLGVRVVDDATGNAIAGAMVAVYRSPGWLLYNIHSDDEATTDAAGGVVLTLGGGDVRVVASAPGFATREGEAQNVGAEGARTTVRLRRGGTLEVTIVDGEGHAVAGARAVVLRASAGRISGVSDAKGLVRFAHVPEPEPATDGFEGRRLALIAANAEGFVRSWLAVEAPAEGATSAARLVLARPRTLSGIVRHRDRSTAAGVFVGASTEEGRPAWGWSQTGGANVSTETGADGRFELSGVTPGRVTVTVAGSLGTQREQSVRVIDVPVAGPLDPLELSAEPEGRNFGTVRVRVFDAAGRGVVGAQVGILAQKSLDFAQGFMSSRRMTSAGGTAEVEPAEAGPWWLSIDAPRSGPVVRAVTADEAARGPIEVSPPNGTIAGRVTRLDGSPARVRLFLTCPVKLANAGLTADGHLGAIDSDADGRFLFVGVGECVAGIQSMAAGLSILEDASQPIRAGRSDLRIVVIDESEAAGLRVEVEVLDAGTRAVTVVAPRVQISRDFAAGYGFAWPVPGGKGIYRSGGILAPGTWHVRVEADGYESQDADVTVTAGKLAPRVRVLLEKSR